MMAIENRQFDPAWEARKRLFAKVHIAKKDLGLSQDEYEAALTGAKQTGGDEWIISAKALSNAELLTVLDHFEKMGWKPKPPRKPTKDQILFALRKRCHAAARQVKNGERRMLGMVKKRAGVERLEWVKDEKILKGIIAALESIKRKEGTAGNR